VPAGGLLLYEDGYRTLSLAVNRGSALDALGLARDAEIQIAPAA
jgi:S-adenosylmethionine hydrolase